MTRALGRVSHCAQNPTYTEVTAGVDIGRTEALRLLNGPCYTGVVRLCQHLLYQLSVRHSVEYPWNEVSCETMRGRYVEVEIRKSEGPIHNTAAAGATCDV